MRCASILSTAPSCSRLGSSLLALWALLVSIPSGCLSDLSVAADAIIECDDDTHCPGGTHVCSAALGRCVFVGVDDVPPSLLTQTLTVEPAVAGAGVEVLVRFEASEALGALPRVSLEQAGAVAIAFDVAKEGGAYIARYLVSGDEAEGFASLAFELVDQDGNRNRSEVPRALELDFTPPGVLESTVSTSIGPPPGSLLATVHAAGTGATVQVYFAVTEPLAVPPALWSEASDGLEFHVIEERGTLYGFLAQVPEGLLEGEHTFRTRLEDLAGNQVEVALSAVVVDTARPAPPLVDEPGAVVLVRAPWGSDAEGEGSKLRVALEEGAVEEGAVVVVRDRADPSSAAELARVGPVVGPAAVTLPTADRIEVYVLAVDAAGNASPAVQVREGRWTATLGGRVSYSDLENPHRVELSALPLSARGSSSLLEPSTERLRALYTADGDALVVEAGRRFEERHFEIPTTRTYTAAAYDAQRGHAVLFGGVLDEIGVFVDDTWLWDGDHWERAVTLRSPPARVGHRLVYDAGRGEVLLFGGTDLSRHFRDTWAFDGASWRELAVGTDGPTARAFSALAYDRRRARTVLFGGGIYPDMGLGAPPCPLGSGEVQGDGSCLLHDTWEWDGADWHRMSPASAPAARAGHAMAWDKRRQAVVLFGGCTEPTDLFQLQCEGQSADTWAWDGESWVEISSLEHPPARAGHDLLATPDGIVVVGGVAAMFVDPPCEGGDRHCFTPWRLDEEGWVELSGAPPFSVTKAFTGAAYDAARDEIVYLSDKASGCPLPGELEDACRRTRLWRGDVEVEFGGSGALPPPRGDLRAAHDPVRGRTVVYGRPPASCSPGSNDRHCTDLWEWDGARWYPQCASNGAPGPSCANAPVPRASPALAYDAVHGSVLMHGGCDDDADCANTWSWDGAEWTLRCAAAVSGSGDSCMTPGRVEGGAMAWDAARANAVFFGGTSSLPACDGPGGRCRITWLFDGVAWRAAASGETQTPGNRVGAELVYDPQRQVVVLFGGSHLTPPSGPNPELCPTGFQCTPADTWEWDGETWRQVEVLDPEGDGGPTGRVEHRLYYDSARGRVVLHGGRAREGFPHHEDTWEYDGVSWRQLSMEGQRPAARYAHAVAYDPARQTAMCFGGDITPAPNSAVSPPRALLDDLWEWDSGARARSSAALTFNFSSARVPASSVRAIDVNFVVGGSGVVLSSGAAPAPQDGVALAVWEGASDRWLDVVESSFGASAAGALVASTNSPEEARGWFSAGGEQLAFRLMPLAGSGPANRATLAIDYAELTVHYRLPPAP